MQAQPQPSQNSQPDNQIKSAIPQPVFYGRIEFPYNGRTISYTDCWQISMLRFLHLVFADGDKISQEKLTRFMDKQDPICQSLIQYFTLNPGFSISSKFYATQQGWKLRSQWCQFCNNSKVLKVKLQDKFEVEATVENSIRFFKAFFPKLQLKQVETVELTLQSLRNKTLFEYYNNILNSIYEQLSFTHKINVHIENQAGDFGDTYLLSALQWIFIDGQHLLDWEIYSFYEFDSEKLGKRQTGHSDYRLH